jgi:hypothetical protein
MVEGLLACWLADLWLGHVPQRCKSRLQRSMPCCVFDQALHAQSAKWHKKANRVRGGWGWWKDCSPVGSRTFGWGMFPNDAKAACSALCLVAPPIKLCLLSPQKGIKKRIVYEVAGDGGRTARLLARGPLVGACSPTMQKPLAALYALLRPRSSSACSVRKRA